MNGLKSLARELPQYGRYNDDMVAHISSDEARLLKSLGGSGTINPVTGLPEFGFGSFVRSITQPVQRAVGQLNPLNPGSAVSKAVDSIPIVGDINRAANNLGTQIFQPLEKAIVQPASAGLAQFDKAVGNTIPGGWGTVASVAGSAMGLPTPFLVGLGALNGSGVTRKGGKFNLQGAMMGGAMAYGAAELGDYMRGAVPPGGESTFNALPGSTDAAAEALAKTASNIDPSILETMTAEQVKAAVPASYANAALQSTDTAALNALTKSMESGAGAGLQVAPPPSITSQFLSGNVGDAFNQIGTNVSEGIANLGTKAVNAYDTVVDPQTYSDLGTKASNYADARFADAAKTGEGIKNLVGAGDMTAKEAAALAAKTGVKPLIATAGTIYAGMGLASLDEQRKYLEESKAANAISQAEYDSALAEINRSTEDARKAVRESPFSTTPSRDVSIGDTFYGRTGADENLYSRGNESSTVYAQGGVINPPDDQTYLPNQTPMQRLENSGIMGYAAGGMPRFLSGGGDGMSDSIPASIEGKQEARLADGEFVIPADVVSHLGNGSSKAGAKQLYSMMDKVRSARTGNKQQGKQINPRKYLAA